MSRYGDDYGWRPYVSVGERKRRAAVELAALRKKGKDVQPVTIKGLKMSKTFWGAAWCEHLESFSDYSNRLPRGRTYVRNGSVCHLGITQGDVEARVAGSELYTVRVKIQKLPTAKWKVIKKRSAGKIGSLLELLQGRLSHEVMQIVTDRKAGLFPLPKEISFRCDCPDWAGMCKHIAAVMYGIGARLDTQPEVLFMLRGVDHEELIAIDAEAAVSAATKSSKSKRLAASDLSDVFGIDLDAGDEAVAADVVPAAIQRKRKGTQKTAERKSVADRVARKKSAKRRGATTAKPPRASEGKAQRKTVKKKKK